MEINHYQININWIYFIFSLVLLDTTIIFSAWLWKIILQIISKKKLKFKTALKIHISSWLLKYLPGKVGVILGKSYLGNKNWKIPQEKIILSSAYEYLFIVLSSFLISFYIIKNINLGNINSTFIFILIILITFLLFFIPKLFYLFFNKIIIFLKKEKLKIIIKLSSKELVIIFILYLINRILFGTSFFLLAQSITQIPSSQFIFIASSFVLASTIGFLAVFAPGGLGVREGILIILLQNIMPLEMAVILSILSRIWLLTGDGILALFILPQKKLTNILLSLKNEKI